jgi:hypothetical protein
VETVRKILSDTSTTADATEASAAVCFTELGFDSGMAASLGREIAGYLPAIIRWELAVRLASGAASLLI